MGWNGFWEVCAEGTSFATFGYWLAPFMLAAAFWVARATSDAPLRWLLLSLGIVAALGLVSTAATQVVPTPFLRPLLGIPLLAPLIAFGAHVLLLVPDGGSRVARLAWAAANLTFIARSTLYLGGFV